MNPRLLLAFLFSATFCVALHAQELDIYDLNDFVDPRILGAVPAPHGQLKCPCDPFLISQLMAGGVANYIDVLRVTDSGASFVHLATSYYRGPWQGNWKVTQLNREGFGSDHPALRSNTSAATPQNKNTLQLARYFAIGPHGSPSIIRMEATWTLVQYRQAAPVNGEFTFASRHENEFGFEGDIPWHLGHFPLITSLVYVGRSGLRSASHPDSEFAEKRVTLLQRAPRVSLGYWSFDTAVAVGSVNAGHWSDLMVQPSLHITSPTIPRLNMRVNFRYAPQVGRLRPPIRGEKPRSETANQFAIFIDRALFARRFH
jgi:hypothetical protein